MSVPKKMTLRVQSAEGTARVELAEDEATAALYARAAAALGLRAGCFVLHRDRARRLELAASSSRRLRDAGLAHGDMLYLSPVAGAVLFDPPPDAATDNSQANNKSFGEPAQPGPSVSTPTSGSQSIVLEEDEVDLELYKMPGSIQRPRDEKLCRHNSKGCCVHCSPLEPWDENYLKEHNIKHMSFHSYLRKITSGAFVSLEEPSFKIKPGCTEHPPWPRGVCSWCRPGAVTLTRQGYRHVDNVLVEHAAVVERFLRYWRASGHQRLGLLLGRYEPHPLVPLGIRARVAAVYEPPQQGSRDHVALLPDPQRPTLDALAAALGLRPVGWIFTDLLPHDTPGQVKHLRGVDTHFLSAQECIMAGHYQNQHPNVCRHATRKLFGSKFVTVCVTGDSENQVHLEGYQVSGQCQALVRDGVLLPTRDAPDLAYVRDSDNQRYVPDVYYKERDAYGNEVGVAARRLPVAYLLVDVPCGVAQPAERPTFEPASHFPPANRHLGDEHTQSLAALHAHLEAAAGGASGAGGAGAASGAGAPGGEVVLRAMRDLHVLLFLCTNAALPLDVATLAPLLLALREADAAAAAAGAAAWAALPEPATLLQLAAAGAEPGAAGGGGAGAPLPVWTCPLCTFHNTAHHDACDMCAMPRNNAM